MSQNSQLSLPADNNTFFCISNRFRNNVLVSVIGTPIPALQSYLREEEFVMLVLPIKIQSKATTP